jgi:hypothetical protein
MIVFDGEIINPLELMNKKEDLCEELEMYYRNDGKLPTLRHPLVFSVPYHEAENAMLNFRLKVKKKECEELLAKQDYIGYVTAHENPYRFNAFQEVQEHFQDEQYWEFLSEIWTLSENIWQNRNGWIQLLTSPRPGRQAFMTKEERAVYAKLPDVVRCYRGYMPFKNMNGISFTLSKEKAEWFANRWQNKGKVLILNVPKKKVFAYLAGRNEQELIIL